MNWACTPTTRHSLAGLVTKNIVASPTVHSSWLQPINDLCNTSVKIPEGKQPQNCASTDWMYGTYSRNTYGSLHTPLFFRIVECTSINTRGGSDMITIQTDVSVSVNAIQMKSNFIRIRAKRCFWGPGGLLTFPLNPHHHNHK